MRVLTLSDICEGGGSRVADCFYNGKRDPDRLSVYSWPDQANPPRREWKIWKKCVDQVWAPLPDRQLPLPLGLWTSTSHQTWCWFQYGSHLYYIVGDGSIRCYDNYIHASRRSQTKMYFLSSTLVHNIPPHACRVSIKNLTEGCVYLDGDGCGEIEQDLDDDKIQGKIIEHLMASSR